MEFAGIWKRGEQVFASPAYYVFQMYSTAKDDAVLPITTNSGSYSVKTERRDMLTSPMLRTSTWRLHVTQTNALSPSSVSIAR
jgi:alpha-L-arabinofuranosidase